VPSSHRLHSEATRCPAGSSSWAWDPDPVLTVTLGGDDSVVVSRSWACTGGPDRFLLARGRVRRQGEDVR
jgi:hypothetical protein